MSARKPLPSLPSGIDPDDVDPADNMLLLAYDADDPENTLKRIKASKEKLKEINALCEQIKKKPKNEKKGMKIKRYYNHDGSPRAKMLKLEELLKKSKETPSILSTLKEEDKLAVALKLKFSVVIDKKGKARAFYKGKENLLGEGSFGRVKYYQDLGTREFHVVKILKSFVADTDTKAENEMTKKAGLLQGTFTRKDIYPERQYQFQKFGGRYNLFFQTTFDTDDGRFKAAYKGKKPNPEDFIDFEERLDIAVKLFKKMDFMHHVQKILHRDLKSENILYDKKTKELTIIDFGFAKDMPDKGFLEDIPLGARHIKAPEISNVSMDEQGKFSEASDVYAGGTVLMDLFGYEPGSQRYFYEAEPNQDSIIKNNAPAIETLRWQTLKKIEGVIRKITEYKAESDTVHRTINSDVAAFEALEKIRNAHKTEYERLRKTATAKENLEDTPDTLDTQNKRPKM